MTRPALLAALGVTLGALAAAPARAADRPAYGGELRVALPLPARATDPALAREPSDVWVARALHATPLRLAPDGALLPGLLAAVPAPQGDGRTFQLRLREGLRFADGSPLGARDLAASLARLLRPDLASPHAWVAVAIQGADEVLDGRAASLPGVQVLSELDLQVTLAFPFPEFPHALAALPAAVVSAGGAGAGPFRREGPAAGPGAGRLVANDHAWRGRPFADAVSFSAPDPRAAARGLEAGALDLVVRPEAAGGGSPLPRRTLAFAAVNGRRLSDGAPAVRRLLAGLDRADLVRRFVRADAEPLSGLLPLELCDRVAPPPLPAGGRAPGRAVVLVPGWLADLRAVGERLQVKLFDAGIRAALEPVDQVRYAARLAAGDYDVALLSVPLLALEPRLAAAQVAGAAAGPRAARRAERALTGLPLEPLGAALETLRAELDLWPLYAAGGRLRLGAGTRLAPFAERALEADGGLDPGDLWRAP